MSDLISTNKVLMHRIFEELWNEGKPALAVEIFAQPAGVERFVNQFLESFPDLHHAVEEIIADGDQVTVKFSAQGTHNGQWLEFAPTGKVIHYSGMTWARIVGGKIIEHYTCWDKAGVIEQIRA